MRTKRKQHTIGPPPRRQSLDGRDENIGLEEDRMKSFGGQVALRLLKGEVAAVFSPDSRGYIQALSSFREQVLPSYIQRIRLPPWSSDILRPSPDVNCEPNMNL